jgi:hypothetical protein
MPDIKCFFVYFTGERKPLPDGDGNYQVFRHVDTDEIANGADGYLPVGAMFYADSHYSEDRVGEDGKSLVVVTPGGWWHIDSRASNCARPDDNVHKCWVRHGTPPLVDVGKNGDTCAAGTGSIIAGNYHGFLRNGILVDA